MNVIESPEIHKDFVYLFNNKGIAELHVRSYYRFIFLTEPDFDKALAMCEKHALRKLSNFMFELRFRHMNWNLIADNINSNRD